MAGPWQWPPDPLQGLSTPHSPWSSLVLGPVSLGPGSAQPTRPTGGRRASAAPRPSRRLEGAPVHPAQPWGQGGAGRRGCSDSWWPGPELRVWRERRTPDVGSPRANESKRGAGILSPVGDSPSRENTPAPPAPPRILERGPLSWLTGQLLGSWDNEFPVPRQEGAQGPTTTSWQRWEAVQAELGQPRRGPHGAACRSRGHLPGTSFGLRRGGGSRERGLSVVPKVENPPPTSAPHPWPGPWALPELTGTSLAAGRPWAGGGAAWVVEGVEGRWWRGWNLHAAAPAPPAARPGHAPCREGFDRMSHPEGPPLPATSSRPAPSRCYASKRVCVGARPNPGMCLLACGGCSWNRDDKAQTVLEVGADGPQPARSHAGAGGRGGRGMNGLTQAGHP